MYRCDVFINKYPFTLVLLTLLHSRASMLCSSICLKQLLHLFLLKIFDVNFLHSALIYLALQNKFLDIITKCHSLKNLAQHHQILIRNMFKKYEDDPLKRRKSRTRLCKYKTNIHPRMHARAHARLLLTVYVHYKLSNHFK
jgi:hypothetical protein